MQQSKKTVLVYVFDGFADWESSYVCAELNQTDSFEVKTVAPDHAPKRSMGGIAVVPDYALDDVPEEFAALLLIGGNPWLDPTSGIDAVEPLVRRAREQGALVGGICNAAAFLAEHGFLDDCAHTGNTLEYVQQCAPHYRGAEHFVEAQAVADRGVVTANGSAALEFAREVLRELGAKDDPDAWFKLHKDGFYPG